MHLNHIIYPESEDKSVLSGGLALLKKFCQLLYRHVELYYLVFPILLPTVSIPLFKCQKPVWTWWPLFLRQREQSLQAKEHLWSISCAEGGPAAPHRRKSRQNPALPAKPGLGNMQAWLKQMFSKPDHHAQKKQSKVDPLLHVQYTDQSDRNGPRRFAPAQSAEPKPRPRSWGLHVNVRKVRHYVRPSTDRSSRKAERPISPGKTTNPVPVWASAAAPSRVPTTFLQ